MPQSFKNFAPIRVGLTPHGLSLTHNGVLPRSGPYVDAPPYPRHGWSAQEGIVDRPGMERRAWLVFLFIFALFNSNSHQNFFTNFALVAP